MRHTFISITLLLVVSALLGADGGFRCSCGRGAELVGDLVLAKGYENEAPVSPTKVFKPTDTFYCIATIDRDTTIEFDWWRVDQPSNIPIETITRTITFTDPSLSTGKVYGFIGSDKPWPEGEYFVVVKLDGYERQRATFRVEAN